MTGGADLTVVPPEVARTPLLREVLGTALRQARQSQDRTLKDVAGRAGVSIAHLSEIERGRKEASSEVIAAITTALGGEMIDLLGAMATILLPRKSAAQGTKLAAA